MGLETGTYISSLNASNPTTSDAKTEGDDHIRLLKSTILATFPNVTGAVTPTHTELNYVDGVTSAIQTQLNAKAAISGQTFTGNVGATVNSQTAYSSGAFIASSTAGDVHIGFNASGASGASIKHVRSGSGVAVVATDGSTAAPVSASDFTIPSDLRLKEHIRPIENTGAIINGLTGYRFNYTGSAKESIGFVAQDVQAVLPELVSDTGGFLSVSYPQVVAVLTEELKSLRARVAKLEEQ